MESLNIQIDQRDDGCGRLVMGSHKFRIGYSGVVDLYQKVIPSIRIDQIPDGINFSLYYRYVTIFCPHFRS